MKERNKLTAMELDRLLAIYQPIMAIVTFFAGFVFATIPVVIFSAEISSLYGRLVLYLLLASLLVLTITIDLYHSAVLRAFQQTLPDATRIFRRYPEPKIADRLLAFGMLFASASISFMLLLKAEEWLIEAFVWLLLSIGRLIFGHYIVHRYLRQ